MNIICSYLLSNSSLFLLTHNQCNELNSIYLKYTRWRDSPKLASSNILISIWWFQEPFLPYILHLFRYHIYWISLLINIFSTSFSMKNKKVYIHLLALNRAIYAKDNQMPTLCLNILIIFSQFLVNEYIFKEFAFGSYL